MTEVVDKELETDSGKVAPEKENHGTVTLTTDPWLKPLVCGICGNQFETGRGLDVHLRSHKRGTKSPGRPKKTSVENESSNETPKKKPGRKPGSKIKSEPAVQVIDERPPGSLRRSSRAPKRASWLQEYLVPKIGGYDDDDIEEESVKTNQVVNDNNNASNPVHSETINSITVKVLSENNETSEVVLEIQSGQDNEQVSQLLSLASLAQSSLPVVNQVEDTSELSQPQVSNQSGLDAESNTEGQPQLQSEVGDSNAEVDSVEKIIQQLTSQIEAGASVDKLKDNSGEQSGSKVEEPIAHVEEDDDDDPDFVDDENDSDYDGKRPYKRRRKSSQGTQVKRECDVCGKMLGTSHMKRHMLAVHLNQKDYVCDREGCDRRFAVVTELRHHIMSVHDKSTSKECTVCGKILSDGHSLKTHMKNKHTVRKPQPEVSCNVCGKIFRNIRACSSHKKLHTMERTPSTCGKCNKTFVNPSKLAFHRKVNPRCDISKHICDLCGYKAASPWRLNNHLQQTHSLARNFECEHCHKCFKTKEMVKTHIHKVHTGTPTLTCEYCDRKFFYKAELKEHSQIHSNVRAYTCHICKQSFKTPHVLKGHLTGKHSDTWFSCGFCKFTTSHKKSMKRHMKLVHKLTNVQLEVTVEDPQVQEQTDALYISTEDGTVQVHIPDSQVQVEELEQTIASSSGNVILTSGSLDVEGSQFTPSCSTVEEVSEVLVALGNMAEAAGLQVHNSQEVTLQQGSQQEVYVATQNIDVPSEQLTITDSDLVKSIRLLDANNMVGEKSNQQVTQMLAVSDDGVVYVSNGGNL